VLPFHQMGRVKWEELKLNYTLNDFQPPRIEAIKKACEQFHAEGLKAFRIAIAAELQPASC